VLTSNATSVAFSTGASKRYGSAGTIARPVIVGPQAFTRGFAALAKAFLAWLTAVWIVNAGRAL
jgi:hypothetical protein